MRVFLITREGVYRHEVPGVFSALPRAKEVARELLAAEPDAYHHYAVHVREVDVMAWSPPPRYAGETEPQPVAVFKRDAAGVITEVRP